MKSSSLPYLLKVLSFAVLVTASPFAGADTFKPSGLYTSHFKGQAINSLYNADAKGGLVRVNWSEIEPTKGNYNFFAIEDLAEEARNSNKKWSLAVLAGPSSPNWLYTAGAKSLTIEFRGAKKTVPQFWDPIVQERLAALATALAKKYNSDTSLGLVYIPQMTANGIEGHFNGTSTSSLTSQGMTADKWKSGAKGAAKSFAKQFSNKALAFEVHEVLDKYDLPMSIINDLWNDASLNQRVGAAVWWLSGRTDYQKNLLSSLKNYKGDIYAQAIASSKEPTRFLNNDFLTLFSQAKAMKMRYIELWNYEFENQTYNSAFSDFNTWSTNTYAVKTTTVTTTPTRTTTKVVARKK